MFLPFGWNVMKFIYSILAHTPPFCPIPDLQEMGEIGKGASRAVKI
jgi:hypothetical protein